MKKLTAKKVNPASDTLNNLSTIEQTLASLTSKQREQYDKKYQDFALSELLLAILESDTQSVRKLAKIAGVSPTIIQSMRSGEDKDYSLRVFFKVIQGLGYKKIKLEGLGKKVNISIPSSSGKN